MPVGIYISVPFCRTKCSFCNFASDVFSKSAFENYVLRIIEDIADARRQASQLGCALPHRADSIYLGGGTPSILEPSQLARIFAAVKSYFSIAPDCEITVECAPGTISPSLIDTLIQCGVNRVSLGVQSFVDKEAKSVGRLHTRVMVLEEIQRLRDAGLSNISIDLIAGLPHQTGETWKYSVAETIAAGVPHASVYMLEVDEESRLGSELLAGGARYHAHFVPDDDATADFYQQGCEMLEEAGLAQYEISNFARKDPASKENYQSRHNLKYWIRDPYIGFGVDAHSMLERKSDAGSAAIPAIRANQEKPREGTRFATPDSLGAYMNRAPNIVTPFDRESAIEEEFFLGLRLNRGVNIENLQASVRSPGSLETSFESSEGPDFRHENAIRESIQDGLLEQQESVLRLTARGRLLSNEVFARFLREVSGDQQRESTLIGR